jgi:hypothetical protein
MTVNTKRGFNRIYIVLALIWAVYCLFLYPLQKQSEAFELYGKEQQFCQERHYDTKDGLSDCLKLMERGYHSKVDMWSGVEFFKRFWFFLLLFVAVFPLVLYGCCRGSGAIIVWIWRGFSGAPT